MNPPIIYLPKTFTDPSALFAKLSALTWEKRDAPRQEYYCNDFPKPYVYGKGRGERLYNPQPYTDEILFIRYEVERITKAAFEVCFLNRYLDQKDQLGWHADDSPEMDDARPIAIVSLGVEREIWFRPKPSPGVRGVNDEAVMIDQSMDPKDPPGTLVPSIQKLKLENGSLCLMAAGMQDSWQHRIPKAGFTCGERISLTFRGYVQP